VEHGGDGWPPSSSGEREGEGEGEGEGGALIYSFLTIVCYFHNSKQHNSCS
jgi:hypothetical protein